MASNIKINLLRNKPKFTSNLGENNYRVYTPGEAITEQKDFMRLNLTFVYIEICLINFLQRTRNICGRWRHQVIGRWCRETDQQTHLRDTDEEQIHG